MPEYKLILTVQDSYGMTKEIEAGIVHPGEYSFTDEELLKVANEMDKTFATDEELATALANKVPKVIEEKVPTVIETVPEVQEVLVQVVEENVDTIKYTPFIEPADTKEG
jgi:type IV secretory pathway ATPase VirB11/archaellum biosynthesis ATPase